MKVITYYDEKRDKGVTVGGMDVCLADAIEAGVIEDIGVAPEYNDIDNPLDIGGHVTSIFDAIEKAKERALVSAQANTVEVMKSLEKGGVPDGVTPSNVGEN